MSDGFKTPNKPQTRHHGLETDLNLKSEYSHGGHFGKHPRSAVPHRFAMCAEAHFKDNVPRYLNPSSNLVLRNVVTGSQDGNPIIVTVPARRPRHDCQTEPQVDSTDRPEFRSYFSGKVRRRRVPFRPKSANG